jgi:hypothetical protein
MRDHPFCLNLKTDPASGTMYSSRNTRIWTGIKLSQTSTSDNNTLLVQNSDIFNIKKVESNTDVLLNACFFFKKKSQFYTRHCSL